MAVKYQDYYEQLNVARTASQDEIQRAYRKMARKYHPDVNKSKLAEEKFKQIGEAYEVLRDPEKRQRYDMLGHNWRNGQDFTPPPGWGFSASPAGESGSRNYQFDDSGDSEFSDFFESMFGELSDLFKGLGADSDGPSSTRRAQAGNPPGCPSAKRPGSDRRGYATENAGDQTLRGRDVEAELEISLEEAYFGGKKSFSLERIVTDNIGRRRSSLRNIEVTIPPGTTEGRRLRLSGQGEPPAQAANARADHVGAESPGDLYLKVKLRPHPVFRLSGPDLEVTVPVAPWEAALGAKIKVPTLEGKANLTLKAGMNSGQKLRLRGKGLGGSKSGRGDLYAVIRIVVPPSLTPAEKELFEKLARVSSFNPRPA